MKISQILYTINKHIKVSGPANLFFFLHHSEHKIIVLKIKLRHSKLVGASVRSMLDFIKQQ